MKNNVFGKQLIDFNKAAFENTFKALVMLQDQMEALTISAIDHSAGMPEDGKRAINEWIGTYKKAREDFKKAVDDGFKMIESFMV